MFKKVLITAICLAFSATTLAANKPVRVIIDSDMGIDDWAATSYLLNNPGVEVIGITTSGVGLGDCEAGAQYALDFILLSRQASKNIPVACGNKEPMDGYHVFPNPIRDEVSDTYKETKLLKTPQQPSKLNGVELLAKLIRDEKDPVTILAIGPLTNIAEVFTNAPELKKNIAQIVIMGGAVHAPGNIVMENFTNHLQNKVAEWNIYLDPLAAQIVFRSGVPITLLPLDGSNHAQVTHEFADDFIKRSVTPEAIFTGNVFEHNRGFISSNEYYFWDPLAAALITNPELCDYETLNIDVVVKYDDKVKVDYALPKFSVKTKDGKPRRMLDLEKSGQTIVSDTGSETKVCIKAKRFEFVTHLFKIMNIE